MQKQSPITEALIREIHAHLVRGVRGNAATPGEATVRSPGHPPACGGHGPCTRSFLTQGYCPGLVAIERKDRTRTAHGNNQGIEQLPGEYRKVPNYVVNSQTGEVIYTPPDAFLVPGMMAELATYLQQPHETHAVLVAGIAQFELVHIHPFLDGNGRAARLLSTLYLYRSGYDFKRLFTLSEFYDRNRPAYYRVLQQVREDDMDLTPWLEYFVEGLAVQLEEVQTEATQGITQLSAGEQQVFTLAKQLGEFGISDLELSNVSRRTVQRHLKSLVDRGLLSQSGATNRRRYRANL